MPEKTSIPNGYHSVQPYLMFKKCAEAISFYTKAFGATERMRMPRPDGGIAHAEIQIGDCVLMMADEAPEMGAWSIEHFGGSPIALQIYTADCDATYKQSLEAGATSVREPADQPYGDRSAGIKDPSGYRWYISTHIKDVPVEEWTAQSGD